MNNQLISSLLNTLSIDALSFIAIIVAILIAVIVSVLLGVEDETKVNKKPESDYNEYGFDKKIATYSECNISQVETYISESDVCHIDFEMCFEVDNEHFQYSVTVFSKEDLEVSASYINKIKVFNRAKRMFNIVVTEDQIIRLCKQYSDRNIIITFDL